MNKQRTGNPDVLDVWMPNLPELIINDTNATNTTFYLKGMTVGGVF